MKVIFYPISILLICVLAAASSKAVPQDIRAEFRFVAGKDMFFYPWNRNGENLQKLTDFINSHREAITSGRAPVRISGYCASSGSKSERRARATMMSNRVKSEMIVQSRLKEEQFITANYTTAFNGEKNIVVVQITIPAIQTVPEKQKVQQEPAPSTEKKAPELPLTDLTAAKPIIKEEKAESEQVEAAIPISATTIQGAPFGKTALRTNLLYLAAGMLNAGIEWSATDKMSLLLNGGWAPWRSNSWKRNLSAWFISPEVRYYPGDSKKWFAAVQLLTASYNIKLSDNGYQGNLFGGGFYGGYRQVINPTFDLDFSLGIGYASLKYDTYRHEENGTNTFIQKGETSNTLFPIQTGINLIWKFGKRQNQTVKE